MPSPDLGVERFTFFHGQPIRRPTAYGEATTPHMILVGMGDETDRQAVAVA
ncbi:hypothetical protein [Streptomyces sp. bgisy084]|uniref:hypothetical protein n=1 Tax=unclassified Streptomyces TaxID=2593676 RepID=UPI003D757F02